MKVFTNLRKLLGKPGKARFIGTVMLFYLLMMVLYGYFMFANLSTAPKFIYAQF